MFVLGDRGVGHSLLVFVEHRVGDRDTFPVDLKSAVRESEGIDISAWQTSCDLVLGQDDTLAFVGERQLWADNTFITKSEHVAQPIGLDV
ncbi:MAG: hypothetical protein ACI82I_001094 [Gammaproteobacteria bacterium]|jgi:hypothetical protein